MKPERIYYEPKALDYPLGRQLREQFAGVEWIPIENHNNISELRANPNDAFVQMKRFLVVGVRKSLRYTPNHKVSDYLVPYTSSGCAAMCLYCYLVCHYNKCAYLRLFVNREEMMRKMIKTASQEHGTVFEIGSNSDLVLENTITGNLVWTIEQFCASPGGKLTFPTKFDMVEPLLPLNHNGRVIFRMSVNPQEVINAVELGTSPLKARIGALNRMCEAGYEAGLLIAPVVLVEGYRKKYAALIAQLGAELTEKTKRKLVIEIIFMTYSFVHRAINNDAFPGAVELYDTSLMTVRGRGRYCYRESVRAEAEAFLRAELTEHLPGIPILYVV
ncbi:MAG TPA: spore photoproduct lyase [Feifaniaceae bacterium]|nr:spore photoproduct lyase [Feifaniaceae bacterium]